MMIGIMEDLIVDDTPVDENNNPIIEADTPENLFNSLISVCNAEHLSYCNCQNKLVETYFNKIMADEIQDMEEKGLITNTEIFFERQEYAKQSAIKLASYKCVQDNIRCPIEAEKIKNDIKHFSSRYDLTDPRVYVIIDALMHQMLSAHRMQSYSSTRGILQGFYDKHGNKSYLLNPVEECKLKYDNARINAITALDKIIEGEKININNSVTVKDINELFGSNIVELPEGEYREI